MTDPTFLQVRRAIPKIAIVGLGRAGKDTAGEYIGKVTPLRYVGSTSNVVCPMIAAELGIPPEEAWASRHQNRMFWYNWCNEYRKHDPAKIIKACLAIGDIVVGIRDKAELLAMKEQNLVDVILWVHRDVPPDPTVTFSKEDCDLVIENTGSIEEYYRKIDKFMAFAGLTRLDSFTFVDRAVGKPAQLAS